MRQHDSMNTKITRRDILKAGALFSAAFAPHSSLGNPANLKQKNAILWLSREWSYLNTSELFPGLSDEQILTLDTDLVYLWRDSLEQEILVNNQTIYGLTNWTDFLLLQGLAQESNLLVNPYSKIQVVNDNMHIPAVTNNNSRNLLISWTISL